MSKKVAFITIHGMGDTPETYYKEMWDELKGRLGNKFNDLYFGHVYYQDLLQKNEENVWGKVAKRLKWDSLRKFVLYGFADAAGLENGKELVTSVYSQAQARIAKEFMSARNAMGGDGPVILLAHSLGCQVASCYFWDAMQYIENKNPKVGIWQSRSVLQNTVNAGDDLSEDEIQFLKGRTLKFFYTTGCNIPIFVAAHATTDILPAIPNTTFEWHNFYDKDDVLGWPLRELSTAYEKVVKDYAVNAGGGVMGWILKSWNPMSHGQYWGDDEILDPLEDHLRQLLG